MNDVFKIIMITLLIISILIILSISENSKKNIIELQKSNENIKREILNFNEKIHIKQDSIYALQEDVERMEKVIQTLILQDKIIKERYEKIYIDPNNVDWYSLDSLSTVILNKNKNN